MAVRVVGTPPEDSPLDVVLEQVLGEGDYSVVDPAESTTPGGNFTAMVVPGQYVARAFVPSEGVAGQDVTFTVEQQALTIDVPAPRRFDITFELRDGLTGSPLVGAGVLLERRAIGHDIAIAEHVESDALGRVRIRDCWEGRYTIGASREGYVVEEWDEVLPGRFEPWLIGDELDLRYRELQPQTTVRFLLLGHESWGAAEDFSIAHGDLMGETPVSFNVRGEAELLLDRFSTPLEVVLTYPRGARDVVYLSLDRSLGESIHEITVEKSHSLAVDLRVDPSLDKLLFDGAVFVQVSYTDAGGNSRQINKGVEGEGVTVLEGPFAAAVVASVVRVHGGAQESWAARELVIRAPESSAILNVTCPPIEIQVIEESGEPCGDAFVLLSIAPDRTNWIAGGSADKDGLVAVPPVYSGVAVVTCHVGGSIRALDHPVSLDGVARRVELSLARSFDYQFAVLVNGEEDTDGLVFLQGALTESLEGQTLRTHVGGNRRSITLTEESAATVTPVVDRKFWALDRCLALTPGLNEVHVRTTGHLVCGDRDRLLTAASVELGEGVSEWIETGRTKCIESAGRASVRVPVGAYIVETPDGETAQVLVETGEETVIQ